MHERITRGNRTYDIIYIKYADTSTYYYYCKKNEILETRKKKLYSKKSYKFIAFRYMQKSETNVKRIYIYLL